MEKEKKKNEAETSNIKENETEQFADINDVLKAFDDIRNGFVQLDNTYSELDKEEREEENYELEETDE